MQMLHFPLKLCHSALCKMIPGHFQATKKSQLPVQNWEQYSSTAVETIFFFYFHFRFMNMYFLAEIL